MMRKHLRGVTLIELLVVVVIVSILAAIAYPNYRQYVQKAKRNEAKAALLQIATNQERHYLNNNQYTTNLRVLGFPVADGEAEFVTETETYRISVTAPEPAKGYTAQAAYLVDDDEEDKCATFTIDARGIKTSLPLDDCWTSNR